MKTTTLIKPEQLASIRSLSLRARLIVEGYFAGIHKSPFHGFSVEFLEYRPYRTGESARSIDWRKFARTDKAVVRLFEDETNLRAHLLIDKSASMRFASRAGLMTKLDYAKTLVASLAWILIRQRDAAGLAAFDETLSVMLPPRSTNVQIKTIIASLDRIEAGAKTRCGSAIESVATRLFKRGLCVVFSDLFDDPQHIIRGLRHLRFKRQDVMVLWILDPLELAFSGSVPYKFRDYETNEVLSIDGQSAARFFREGLDNHRNLLARACRELSVDLEIISTEEPFQKALTRIMEKRERLQ
ncbi:MAG: DUF58 domain-containing protein [Chitinispirillaceae bacterium]|jgi:uncharacterized protein (DUF58 family)